VPLAVITDYMGDDTSLEVELFREAGVDAFVAPGPDRAAGRGGGCDPHPSCADPGGDDRTSRILSRARPLRDGPRQHRCRRGGGYSLTSVAEAKRRSVEEILGVLRGLRPRYPVCDMGTSPPSR
jgi:hypothetical protein